MKISKTDKIEIIEFENLIKNDIEIQQHLKLFIKSFIQTKFQNRWFHMILEKPSKGFLGMVKFERHNNPKYCTLFKYKDYQNLRKANKLGLFFNGKECMFTKLSNIEDPFSDAIFSVKPGREVNFLFHELWFWKCIKK